MEKELLKEIEQHEKHILNKKERLTEIMLDKYLSCNHFVMVSDIYHDYREGRSYISYGCPKCGLDENCYDGPYDNTEKEIMSKAMRYYFPGYRRLPGYKSDIEMNFIEAKELCEYILSENPDISNEELERKLKGKVRTK